MMNLEDFVTEALKQVINGVKNAQKYADEAGAKINPAGYVFDNAGVPQWHEEGFGTTNRIGQVIEFDIALVATEANQLKGGIGVFSPAFGLGYQAQKGQDSSTTSRIRFSVPVFLPVQDNRDQ